MDNFTQIQRATVEDSAIIESLGAKTFSETYADIISHPAVQQYMERQFCAERIKEAFGHPFSCFFIGFVKGEPVAFTRLRNDRIAKGVTGKKMLEIEQIYVLQEYQGFNVGKEMIEKCRQVAVSEKYDVLWLQVRQQNQKAIRFYQKAGFVIYETTQFSYSDKLQQDDFLMRLDLYY